MILSEGGLRKFRCAISDIRLCTQRVGNLTSDQRPHVDSIASGLRVVRVPERVDGKKARLPELDGYEWVATKTSTRDAVILKFGPNNKE